MPKPSWDALHHKQRGGGMAIPKYTERINTYGIVLTAQEAVQFLRRSAVEFEIAFCTAEDCPVCTEFVTAWNAIFIELPEEHSVQLYKEMESGEWVRPQVTGWGR